MISASRAAWSVGVLVSFAAMCLGASCEQPSPRPSPAPEPTVTAPPEPPPLPPPAPTPSPTPEPPAPPPDSDRCSLAYGRTRDLLECPPRAPACPDAGACPTWVEFCRTVEGSGISVGSKCLLEARDCAAVAACAK